MDIRQLMEAGVARYHSARDYDDVSELDSLVELLEAKCSNALAAYQQHPHSVLLRGLRGRRNDVFIQDTRSSSRVAENTDNYVTLFSEVLQSWKHLPPRSKIISCTPSMKLALDYSDDDEDNIFVVIPTDNSTLTYCGAGDFWGSLPMIYTALGSGSGVSAFNMHLRKLIRATGGNITPTSAQELVAWCKSFDEMAPTHQFSESDQKNPLLTAYNRAGKTMLELVDKLLDPVNAIASTNGRVLVNQPQQEVAVFGEVVYVRKAVWDLLF